MVDALPLRIFLASPGDLADEREAVRECVAKFNVGHDGPSRVAYEVIGWDRVRGTVRRPQEAINELIAESHFMVALFKGSWGSEPGSPWGYTSGTEEELFTAFLELGQPEQPMRDIWVGFIDAANPDEKITSLRQRIIDRHAAMFETVSDTRDGCSTTCRADCPNSPRDQVTVGVDLNVLE